MTNIQAQLPFALSTEDDGTQHAIRENIKVSVLPDVKANISHRNANRPFQEKAARWLIVKTEDGLNIYIHGTHVVVTKKELIPTFKEEETAEDLLNEAFRLMKVEKIDGRYTAHTKRNKEILAHALDRVQSNTRRETVGTLMYAKAKLEEE